MGFETENLHYIGSCDATFFSGKLHDKLIVSYGANTRLADHLNFAILSLIKLWAQDEIAFGSTSFAFKKTVFDKCFDVPFEPVGRQFCCSDNAFEGDPLGKEYRCQHHQALDGNRLAVSLLIFKDEPEEIDVGLAFREKDTHVFFSGFGIVR